MKESSRRAHERFSDSGKKAAVDLIGIVILVFIAVVVLLVTVFDALGRVLAGAVAAIARAPRRVRDP